MVLLVERGIALDEIGRELKSGEPRAKVETRMERIH